MSKYLTLFVRIWKLFKPFHKVFYSLLIVACIIGALEIYNTSNLGNVVTAVSEKDLSKTYTAFIIYAIFLSFYWTFDFIYDYVLRMYFSRKTYYFLREHSIKEVLKLNIHQYQENNSAIKFDTVATGESSLIVTLQNIILNIVPSISVFFFTIFTLSKYSLLLTAIVGISCILVFVMEFRYQASMRPLWKDMKTKNQAQYKISLEAFAHLSLIKMLSIENKFIKRYIEKREENLEYFQSIDKREELYSGKRNYIIMFVNIIAIYLAIQLYFKGTLLIGAIFVIFSLTNRILWKARDLQRDLGRVAFNYVDIEKYLDLIDLQPEFNEHGKLKLPARNATARNAKGEAMGGKDAEEVNTEIVFKNLSFRYPKGDSNVLDDVNLTIPHGKRTAFVGHSGSGKTTIVKLLMRAYDYTTLTPNPSPSFGEGNHPNASVLLSSPNLGEGARRADEGGVRSSTTGVAPSITIGGLELRDIDSHSLRSQIGYVEQHVDLFDTTVRDNILMSVDEDTMAKWEKLSKKTKRGGMTFIDQKLDEVSRLARIDEFYHRLGDAKWDTEIGERGIKLSGGERQRVGIARAIIKDPSILILDEATSALDTVNEKYIKEAIDNVSRGRTTIIIAHRLSTVEDADMIVVMDKGQIVATGTHYELLVTSSHYQDLIQAQLK